MQPKENNDVKTDLRHDNMEFSAATDGDDKMDADDFNREEDGISGEVLDALEDESDVEMAAALNAVEMDRMVDAENLPEESDEDDYYDNDEVKEEEERL
ncbi:MAG: hypothetical protein LH615_13025 [Ferruginibacter sp.]|nr:hypothetical protein [Ferruginibacter sp.]